ncbi:hypothetical protein BWI17_10400 [Betaproteobacteria bacterium GR16-43]|nr:hypothetical protein BWI17_10400 [Betaproteobacteria bacterium GR16-43]
MAASRFWMLALGTALSLSVQAAEEPFDACDIFTQKDAEAALGTAAQPETFNPKVKRPKVITKCTYTGFKEGKPVSALVEFRFGRTEGDTKSAFGEHRLQVQTKPMMMSGAEAFWSAKTGQMNLRKERTWVQISVGPAKVTDRDPDQARKVAELLLGKI